MSIRGLPDERPRPSVANLIGKFEQRASKRQSSLGPGSGSTASPTASPSQSRSTSVVSNTTGDAAAIEAKERREWPPRNFNLGATNESLVMTNTNPNTNTSAFSVANLRSSLEKSATVQAESARISVASPPPDASVSDGGPVSLSASVENIAGAGAGAGASAKQDGDSSVSASDPSANSDANASVATSASVTVPEEVKSDPGTRAGAGKKDSPAAAANSRAPGKLTTSKSTNSVRGSAGTGASTKTTTPRPSIAQSKFSPSTPAKNTVPATKSLTAQRTGNSTIAASRTKTPTAPRASTSSAKASPAVRSKTPTASRAKTPTATTAAHHPLPPSSPPKLPSSGLYAPTKASLARARNAEMPAPPKHEKKVSSSALERLMKPTAASASKARETPVSPPRAPPAKTAGAGRGTPTTRGKMASTLKPRVGLAPARMKAEREKKEEKTKEKAGTAKPTIAAATAVAATATNAGVVAAAEHEDGLKHEHEQEHDLEHEQPSFVSSAHEDESVHYEEHEGHEEEHEEEHEPESGPPSDIESYDDAFASDEDGRELHIDSAHLHSARPSDSGEGEEGTSFSIVDTPEPGQQVETAGAGEAGVEGLEFEHATDEDAHNPDQETEETQEKEQEQEVSISHTTADDATTNGTSNGAATPTPATLEHKQNGDLDVSPSKVPETEFDSVLDMLSVKPPVRAASPSGVVAVAGEIPDEDEEL